MKKFFPILLLFVSFYCQAQKTFKVGIISYKSDQKVKETFEPIFQHVANELNQKLELSIVPEADLGFHVANHDFDIGVFTIFPYLKAKEDFSDLHVSASHQVKGESSFYGVVLTRKSSNITDLHQLKGKRFLFVKPTSTSGYKYPKGIFTESHLNMDDGFMDYSFSYNHNASLDSLIAGKADGIAINESYLLERKGLNLADYNVLSRYEVPYHAYVFAPGIDSAKQYQIEKILFSAHKNPKAKRFFDNSLRVSSIEKQNDDYYNIIRRYLRITRVKPVLDLQIKPQGKAAEKLAEEGDLLKLVADKSIRGLLNSNRFVATEKTKNQYYEHVLVNLYQVSKGKYHYQVLLNNLLVDEGVDIPESELSTDFHRYIKNSVLSHLPIETSLFFNGEYWLINYGKNDGLTLTDYQFKIYRDNGSFITLEASDISEMSALDTHFHSDSRFEKGARVKILYNPVGIKKIQNTEEEEETTINIFSPSFYKTQTWDKLGLIIGISLTILSALIGSFLRKRKKDKFKGLLSETNELIKECVGGHFKMENKIIEQKEKISSLLESGKINENQFLILKNRLSDLQGITESLEPHHIQLTPEQKEQIELIVSDGKITEKEFLKIKNILKKRGAVKD